MKHSNFKVKTVASIVSKKEIEKIEEKINGLELRYDKTSHELAMVSEALEKTFGIDQHKLFKELRDENFKGFELENNEEGKPKLKILSHKNNDQSI